MFRRLSCTAFALLFGIVACGHQVTPNPTAAQSDLTGDIVVKFETDAALDFNNVTYVIAMDLCGTGVPYPNAFNTGYSSYSYAFLIGGGFGGSAEPELFQYYLNPNSAGLTRIAINNLNPSSTQFVTPYQGNANEFEFVFPRSDLNNPFNVVTPCPNSTTSTSPTPSASATASPTTAAGASPTASASGEASASPAASPSPSPSGGGNDSTGVDAPPYLTTWTFNFMTFNASGGSTSATALDSLGPGGPNDASYSGLIVNTAITTTVPFFRPTPISTPSNLAAYITYAEVDTYAK